MLAALDQARLGSVGWEKQRSNCFIPTAGKGRDGRRPGSVR
jgi:hypothetical protein